MGGHVHSVTTHIANPYAAVLLDRVAENRRAAIVRRKLLNAARDIEAGEGQEAIYIRGAWQESKSKDGSREPPRKPLRAEPDPAPALAVSFWA